MDIIRVHSDVIQQQPVNWVVDEVGRAVVEVREKGPCAAWCRCLHAAQLECGNAIRDNEQSFAGPGVLKDGVLDTVDIVKACGANWDESCFRTDFALLRLRVAWRSAGTMQRGRRHRSIDGGAALHRHAARWGWLQRPNHGLQM